MQKAFQSYTPRVRPLEYDSLLLDSGCQDLPEGNDFFLTLAFARICIFPHDLSSAIFNQPETVAYTIGPTGTGEPLPWSTSWAAWVGPTGVRVKKTAFIAPGSTLGALSSLFPTSKPTKLAIGFLTNSQMAIAIQKTTEAIQVKWFKDDSGLVESIGDVSFTGNSPAFFQNGMIAGSDDEDENDLVLYYLQPADPRKVFARFEREHFTIEHEINARIQTDLDSLKSSATDDRKQVLYARDLNGRDITLTTDDYVITLDGDAADLSMAFTAGQYINNAEDADAGSDSSTIEVAFTDGRYHDPVETTGTLSGDAAELSLAFTAGEYL